MAGKIFISYRRDDVRADARDIAGRLSRTFGERNVFMDVDNLLAGQRFDKELETALALCDVFIAVIGNQWANLLAERQVVNERDFVVDEIAAAVERGIPVIPVLVDGAPLPQADALPASIAALPLHQTHEVKHESFGRDVEALIAAIEAVRSTRQSGVQGRLPWGKLAAALALLVVVAAGTWVTPPAIDWWEQRQEAARPAEGAIPVKVGMRDKEGVRRLMPGAGEAFRDCPSCPEMAVVPAGSFRMGSKAGDPNEKPVHTVTIAKPFAVGRFEVTFAEWGACVAAGGCRYNPSDKGWGRGRRPVINVNWDDTQQYVVWLSRMTGKRYRLLSEVEWEYAARAGRTTEYAFGDTISKRQAQFSASKTVKVGSFKPNAFGLYDMHGNVWERVGDCWNGTYKGAPKNGSPWTAGNCSVRVLRGGSWFNERWYLRSTMRNGGGSDVRGNSNGFRVARTL